MALNLKKKVETELGKMLQAKDEPSEYRMKLLKLAIGFLAVQAKLEENEYGDFFKDGDNGTTGDTAVHGPAKGQKPSTRRKPGNGAADATLDFDTPSA